MDNASSTEKDRRRIQPKGMELRHLHRHKLAQLCNTEPYFECWPGDQPDDLPKAEDAEHLLRHFLTNPKYRFKATERMVVSDALGIGVGVLAVEWHPELSRILFRKVKTERFMPAPGWVDIHDPTCPYVIEESDEPLHIIVARGKLAAKDGGWSDTQDLWPDCGGRYTDEQDYKSVTEPRPDPLYSTETVRTVRIHFRDSGERDTRAQQPRTLAADEQYMGCQTCGNSVQDHPRLPDNSLPMMGEPCPYCAQENPSANSYLQRIEQTTPNEVVKRYPKGKLCIFAPYQRRIFYEGPWQAPMRTFPFEVFKAYEHPEEFIGQSDTSLHWSHQTVLNAMRRLGYEQMQTSKPLLVFADDGDGMMLTDADGDPFVFSDAQGQTARWHGPPGTLMGSVHQFQGNGLPGAFVSFYQIMQSAFQSTQGIDDLGLTAQNSKDIAASTVSQLKQMGEIPVEDHRAVLNESREPFFGAILDLATYVMTDAEAVRVFGPDGSPKIRALKGTDLPQGVDVIVTTSPSIKQASMEDFQKVQAFGQMDPALQVIAARALNIPSTLLRQYQSSRQQQQPQKPQVEPDKLLIALAALIKAGEPVTVDVVNAALDMAGLPPIRQGAPPAGPMRFGAPPQGIPIPGAPPDPSQLQMQGPPQPNGFAAPQAGGLPSMQ